MRDDLWRLGGVFFLSAVSVTGVGWERVSNRWVLKSKCLSFFLNCYIIFDLLTLIHCPDQWIFFKIEHSHTPSRTMQEHSRLFPVPLPRGIRDECDDFERWSGRSPVSRHRRVLLLLLLLLFISRLRLLQVRLNFLHFSKANIPKSP